MRVRFFRPLLTSTPVLISLIMVAVCGNLHAQNPAPAANVIEDYSLLTKPEIAAAAKLTEDQSAAVKQLITERDAAVAAAEESSRPAIMAESNEKLKAVLTSDQQRLFVSLFVGKTLRFNFRNQKWTDVLAWISKEADLSLVMETPPPGTFTYADSKDYSTIEAIDLLNGWLLTKGFTLVRRERMLMCLNLKGGLPEGTIPRITLAELATRGRYEFVSVLIPLDGRPPEAVLLEVKPLLGSYGNAEPLAQTQQLLVSDTAANLRIIEQIVQKIPIPQKPATPPAVEPPKPVLTVYPIEHANPVQAGEVLKQIIAGTVVVDEKALQISVNAIPTEQDKAKTIIAQLESNQGPDKQPKLQLYSVTVSDADQMLATVKLIAPDGQYRIDAVSGKLIAWANENDQAHIAESLQMIQADQPQLGGRQLQVYALKNAEPGAVSTILATVVPGARITVNSATRSLIAFGSLADHESIRALIEQLETQTNSAATEKVLVTYPASAANSSTIVTLLATVVPQAQVISDTAHQRLLIMATADEHARVELLLQSMAVAETDGKRLQVHDANHIDTSSVSALLATLTPQAAVTIDAINKRLLVVASEQDQARVTDVLTQVRTTDAESNRALKSYPLQPKTNSSTIVTLLASLVPRAAATIDDVNRRLLITATEDEHTLIDQVIQQVQKDAVGVQPELRFYPLTKVSGPTSLTILQSIAPQATITFQADANRYSVIATTNDHDAIAATLEKMETASQDLQRDLKFYDVGTIGGADTRTLLASTYTDVTFVANADGSKLMAWVSPMQDEKIQATLEQLLTERPFQANRTMELYSITDLGPSASTVLSQAVPNSTISAGARADQLAIVATAADHEKLRGILEQLQRTKVSRELKFYPLQNVPGPTSLTILQSIAPQATITFQADGNRYSVIATANEHDAIAATLEKMETRSDDVQRDLKFYDVGTIGAADTRTLLASTFADVTFVPTAEGNKLMAWVSPGQDERIQATLKQLAVEKPFQATRTMQLYSIRDLGPTASTVLSQAVPTATITVGARSDQLAIVATAADHEKLAKVLQQLEATKSFPPRKSLVIHQIKGVTPQSVLQVLQPLVDGEVQLTIDPAGQQLFVRAFPDKQGDITAVINQITEQLTENGVRSTKTYIVGAPNADEAQEVLAALFPDAKIVSDADRKMIIATATPDQHATIEQVTAQMKGATLDGDQPVPAVYSLNSASATEVQTLIQSMYNRFDNVRLSINEKTGRLVVLARPDQHEAIRPLIEQLDNDSATATDLELAVFRLNQLDVQAVQQALEPLLPRNAQVTSDRSARQLLVSASKGDMPAIREMVQQMISTQGTSEGLETRSYRLRRNEADEAQEVLEKLFPDATLVTDVSQEVLVATATPEQHETIASVVQQMTNVAPDVNSPKAIAYPLKAADGANAVLVFCLRGQTMFVSPLMKSTI
jgi:type II secretory pathway component GspD/PulD (secretin)